MDFVTAVRTCLTTRYATFSGRARRSEYWWFFLFQFVVSTVLNLIWMPLYFAAGLVLFIPTLAAAFRRLQDTGRPGWWVMIFFGVALTTTLLAARRPGPMPMSGGPERMMSPFGGFALVQIMSLVTFALALLLVWWLTRPSDPEPNAYGAPPA